MKVDFVGSQPNGLKKFRDLDLGATFRIRTARSTGVVYLKCMDHHGDLLMLDFTTFTVFPPTNSDVEEVDSECLIHN